MPQLISGGRQMISAKKLLPVLAAVIIAVILSFSVSADEVISAPGGEVSDYDGLIAALGGDDAVFVKKNDAGKVLYITLRADIKLEKPVHLTEGDYCLSGAGVTVTAAFDNDSMIILGGEKKATLAVGNAESTDSDSIIFDGGSDSGRSTEGSVFRVSADSELSVYTGTVIKNSLTTVCGAAVYSEGTVTFYGGKIENCRSTGSGGAFFNKGKLFLAAGSISDGSAEFGGAVYNEGTADLIGTEITSCTATKGGAVFSSGTLNFTSSSVTGCKAAEGAGVYSSGNVTFAGGQITDCTSTGNGGAVYNSGNAAFSGTYFSDNSAQNGGTLYNSSIAEMSDGSMYTGTAVSCGGNIYNGDGASLVITSGSVGRGEAVYGGGIYNLGTLVVGGGGFTLNKADAGQAILNAGKLTFNQFPYIDSKNDVFILDGHPAEIESEMKAELIAVLTPGTEKDGVYSPLYSEDIVLIDGEFAAISYVKFKITPDGENEWILSFDGRISKKLPVYYSAWFWIVIVAVYAALITGIVFAVRFCDKKRKAPVKAAKA